MSDPFAAFGLTDDGVDDWDDEDDTAWDDGSDDWDDGNDAAWDDGPDAG